MTRSGGGTAVALVGAALAVLVVPLAGGAIVLAQQPTRPIMTDVGSSPALRPQVAARWVGSRARASWPARCSPVTVASGGPPAVWSFLAWAWVVPYASGVLASGAIFVAYLRPPPAVAE